MSKPLVLYKICTPAGLIAGALLSAACLAACGGSASKAESNANTAAAKTIETTTARAVVQNVPSFIQATGSLAADESSDVAPQVSGQIAEVSAGVGSFVRQGDVVARLNDRDARIRLEQSQASESQAEAAVRQSQARLGLQPNDRFDPNKVPEVLAALRTIESSQDQEKTLSAQVKNAEAQARLAEDTLRRFSSLLETGDTSRLSYNQYRAQAEQAREQVNAVKSQVNEARARTNYARQQYEAARNAARGDNQGILSAQSSLDNARAATALAQKVISDAVIRAPFAGLVSDRPVAVGEYVTPSSIIVTVVRTNPIKVNVQLPEAEAGRVGAGQGVSISVAAYQDRQFAGRITAVNPSLNADSRALTVEAQIENPDNALRPNMFATARIILPGGKQSVFVPFAAVQTDADTNTANVYVIADGKAQARAVQTGTQEGDLIEILTGVNEGEIVATSNLEQLFDGAKVQS